MQFRDLQKQYQELKPEIDAAVTKVMTDCNFISGAQVKALEQKLAEYVGVKHCITCANGTDALKLAERAYGIGAGHAVFVPDFTFFSTAETVADLGAVNIFVDVDEDTFNMSPAALETAILRVKADGKLEPKAIVAVDLFGLPADYPAISAIAKKYGLILIEDGAQGFGGRIGETRACAFGDIATTSFFPAKPLGCYGDGGAIFTNDDAIAAQLRSLCVHGKSGNDKYNNIQIGMNSRLDTIQAAILDIKLDAFARYELDGVNHAAMEYNKYLSGKVKTPVIPGGYYSSWAQYTIQLPTREKRDAMQAALKEKGIPTMVYYPRCMHEQGAFEALPYSGECPTAERLRDTVLSLPMHPYLEDDQIKYIAENVLMLL
ncbi:MAG: DegT/DnrJ/EryC1/StrS family aminotransferase [Oscillospiraceae bacterium]|nr:DegT/DnrJ/EryC1/StrS family aminotransferase [Oscillospiraceae bacterium]